MRGEKEKGFLNQNRLKMETRHKFSFFLERTEKDGDRRGERKRNGRKTERREEKDGWKKGHESPS